MPLKAFTSDFSTTSVCVIEQSPVKSQIANHTQAKYSHSFKHIFCILHFLLASTIPLRYICSDLIKYINFSVCWSSDSLSSWPICVIHFENITIQSMELIASIFLTAIHNLSPDSLSHISHTPLIRAVSAPRLCYLCSSCNQSATIA